MSKSTMEDIIHGEVNRLLRAGGLIGSDVEVRFSLPGPDTFMLPIHVMKDTIQERVVCKIL